MAIDVVVEPPAPRGERVRRRRSLLAHIGMGDDLRKGTAESGDSATSACRTEGSDDASLSDTPIHGERRGSFSHHHLRQHLQKVKGSKRKNRRDPDGFANRTTNQVETADSPQGTSVEFFNPREVISRSLRECQNQKQSQDHKNILRSRGRSPGRSRPQVPRKFARRYSQESSKGTSQPEKSPAHNLVTVSNALLQHIRECLSERTEQKGMIDQRIAVDRDRAMARYHDGNNTGAVLSMKKIKKLEVQQINIATAIAHLRTAEVQVMSIAEKAKYDSTIPPNPGDGGSRGDNNGRTPTTNSSPSTGDLNQYKELAKYSNIKEDVKSIMSRETSTDCLADEDLLDILDGMNVKVTI